MSVIRPFIDVESMLFGKRAEQTEGVNEVLEVSPLARLALIEREEKPRAGSHDRAEAIEAGLDVRNVKMRENRLCQEHFVGRIFRRAEPFGRIRIVQQGWGFLGQILGSDELSGGFDSRARNIHAGVTARVEITDEVPAASQGAAANVQHPLRRANLIRDKIVELQLSDLIPAAADRLVRIVGDAQIGMAPVSVKIR